MIYEYKHKTPKQNVIIRTYINTRKQHEIIHGSTVKERPKDCE